MANTLILRSASFVFTALIVALFGRLSPAFGDTLLFQDDFTRSADSVNDPELGSPGNWVLTRNSTIVAVTPNADAQILTGIVRIEGTQTGPQSQRLFFNSAGQVPGPSAYPNNNDMASAYHTFNLDAQQQYTETFKYALHHLSTYPLAVDGGAPSQVNGGDFIIPRRRERFSRQYWLADSPTGHFRRIGPSAECAVVDLGIQRHRTKWYSGQYSRGNRFVAPVCNAGRYGISIHRGCERRFGDAVREWQSRRYQSRPGAAARNSITVPRTM